MKSVLLWQQMIKLGNKEYFMENNAEIMQYMLEMQKIFLLPKYIRRILGMFFNMYSHLHTQFF